MNLNRLINPDKFELFMLDVESDGLSTWKNSMTSLCIVKFDGSDGTVQDFVHAKFSHSLRGRYSDTHTLNWRKDNNVDEMESLLPSLPINELLREVHQFLGGYNPTKKAVLFANHTEIDISFLKGYYESKEIEPPWQYNKVFEMNSILLGREVTNKAALIEKVLQSDRWKEVVAEKFGGKELKHNAFFDCVFQIELLMAAFKE